MPTAPAARAFTCVVGLLVGFSAAVGAPEAAAARSQGPVSREIIVRFEPAATAGSRAAIRREAGVRRVGALPVPDMELVRTRRGAVVRTLRRLASEAGVVYAERNALMPPAALPDDPRWPEQWALRSGSGATIAAPAAWDITTGSREVTVAVLDSGIDPHPDIAANLWRNPGESGGGREDNARDDDGNGYVDDWRGWNFVDGGGNNPFPGSRHGTHVGGIIGAVGNNAIGVAGVAHRVSLMPLRTYAGTTAEYVEAVAYAQRNGAKVVNGSFGEPGRWQALEDAIAQAPDVLFVFAAGNDGADQDVLPLERRTSPCSAPLPNVVCVAASDAHDQLASFSNYGRETVDLAAPGAGILGLDVTEKMLLRESFEAPLGDRWSFGGEGSAWARSADAAYCCGYGLSDSPAGDYGPNVDGWAQLNTALDLRDKAGCWVGYKVRHDLAVGDVLLADASVGGAAWSTIGEHRGTTRKDGEPTFFRDWDSARHSLRAFDRTADVRVRLRLKTDADGTDAGVSVDQLYVFCDWVDYRGHEYRVMNGTSMAAPHVAGAAALLLAHRPQATPVQVREALLTSVDRRSQFEGKMASGGRLNVRAALLALAGEGGGGNANAGTITDGEPPAAEDDGGLRSQRPSGGSPSPSARAQGSRRRTRCTARLPRRVTVRDLVRGKLGATVRCARKARIEVNVRASGATRRRLGTRRSAVIARAHKTVPSGASVRIRLRPRTRVLERIRALGRGSLTLTVAYASAKRAPRSIARGVVEIDR